MLSTQEAPAIDSETQGCLSLWAKVMEQAMEDLQEPIQTPADRLIRERAFHWFRSSSNEPCSFIWVCGILDLDPDKARARVFKAAWERATRPVDIKAEEAKESLSRLASAAGIPRGRGRMQRLAAAFGMSRITLYGWRRRGLPEPGIRAIEARGFPRALWLVDGGGDGQDLPA